MSPAAIRSARLLELSNLVHKMGGQGKSPELIIKAVRDRAHQMACSTTAEEYVSEVIRRFS